MSIEYDMSKFPRSRGAPCGVLLDRVTTPVKRPHEITESEVELIEVTEEKVDRVENQKDESIPVDDKELKLFLELKEKKRNHLLDSVSFLKYQRIILKMLYGNPICKVK